jgi:hypothetical protein
MPISQIVVAIVAVVLAVVAARLRGRRLGEGGWPRVLALILVPFIAGVVIALATHRHRVTRTAPQRAPAPVPPPAAAP